MRLKSAWCSAAALLLFAGLPVADARAESRADAGPLRPVACWFETPESRTVDCYRLRVPETRDVSLRPRRDGAVFYLDLPVVIVRAERSGPNVPPDSIVYLAGGPGDGAWVDPERIEWWWDFFAANDWSTSRDFILFDQRGSGMSEPRIDCPDAQEVALQLLGLPDQAADALEVASTRACAESILAAGHDPAAYTSIDNAEDLHDLFRALRIPRWNVYGLSYGTRLALEYMRRHPDDIRSVILDSVLPPDARLLEDDARNTIRAFKYLIRSCKGDESCGRDYRTLSRQLLNILDRYEKDPLIVSRPHPNGGGAAVEIRIDAGQLLNRLFLLLYNRGDIAYLPRLIDAYDRGLMEEITEDLDLYLTEIYGRADFGDAMFLSVQCFEEFPFNDLRPAATAAAEDEVTGGTADTDFATTMGKICTTWRDAVGISDARSSDGEPVTSDLPTLILTGMYDPVTPPSYGERASQTLANSFFYRFPDIGHDALGNASCPNELVASFLENPSTRPADACLDREDPIRFIPPAAD